MMKKFFRAITFASLLALPARAQWFNFATVAGSAGQGAANGAGAAAQFNSPGGVAMDPYGNLFVADTANDAIRKIAPNGTVSTFAGSPGISGSADGTNGLFNAPLDVAADSAGNIYVADTGNFTIRKITPAGVVSTLAGSPGLSGSVDGTGTNALFHEPEGIAVDSSSNLYVADTWNHTIRKITPAGAVTTLAGLAGNFGSANGTGTNAQFYEPQGITVDSSGNVYVADTGNNIIREISPAGAVTTLAGAAGDFGSVDADGTNAVFYSPEGISVDADDNLYVADAFNNTLREVTPAGAVTTIAGAAGIFGSAEGTNASAQFWNPEGILVNPTNNSLLYVADTGNSTIRQLSVSGTNWVSSTLAGSASIGANNATGGAARFFWPVSVAMDASSNIYVADAANNTIREITPAGAVSTIAGSPGIAGSADGPAASALFDSPEGVAVDASGNIFVSDTGNGAIREISAGTVSTLAGSAGNFGGADGTNSTAEFFQPEGIAVDGSDNVFVADTFNHTIRQITAAGVVTTLAGTAGSSGEADGTNGAAQFNCPTGMAIDNGGNLYVTDLFNHTIRKVTPAGVVTTLAGLAGVYGSSDGANSAADFFEPEGIAVNGTNVFVTDSGNDAIRQLTPAGTNWVVSTVAGWAGNSGSTDGSGIAARFSYPAGIVLGAGGTLFVADSANNTIRSGVSFTNSPPDILSQPQSQAVDAGATAAFSVGATGSATLYYQWQFNGVNIPGATASGWTVTDAQAGSAGNYSVIVRSPTGSIVSSNATLTVYSPPAITNQPVSQACLQGATVTFSVLAGPPPLAYQWLKNGSPVFNSVNASGLTTATLTLTNVTAADDASYSVQVNNGYGAVASSPATLNVLTIPPADSVQPYAWWPLEEGAGTVAFDFSGNGHTGTLNSGASWTAAGHGGNAVYFNATSLSLITLSNPFRLTANNWTATMWVNRWESKSSSTFISGSHDALKLEQYEATNRVGYTIYGTADYPLNYTTPVGGWMHLAFVETSAGVSLYTNGVLAASNTAKTPVDASAIGCYLYGTYTDYLDATLDDVRVYNSALTAANIASLAAYGRISPIPAVSLTAPANDSSFTVSSNIVLTASVITNGQTISAVQFYAGASLLGQTSASPYTWTWTNVPAGTYLLTAQTIYNGSSTVTSPPVGIGVTTAATPTTLTATSTNGMLQLSWPPDHTGWVLQAQTNPPGTGLGTNWVNNSGSATTNLMIIPIVLTNGSVFYRLTYP